MSISQELRGSQERYAAQLPVKYLNTVQGMFKRDMVTAYENEKENN